MLKVLVDEGCVPQIPADDLEYFIDSLSPQGNIEKCDYIAEMGLDALRNMVKGQKS